MSAANSTSAVPESDPTNELCIVIVTNDCSNHKIIEVILCWNDRPWLVIPTGAPYNVMMCIMHLTDTLIQNNPCISNPCILAHRDSDTSSHACTAQSCLAGIPEPVPGIDYPRLRQQCLEPFRNAPMLSLPRLIDWYQRKTGPKQYVLGKEDELLLDPLPRSIKAPRLPLHTGRIDEAKICRYGIRTRPFLAQEHYKSQSTGAVLRLHHEFESILNICAWHGFGGISGNPNAPRWSPKFPEDALICLEAIKDKFDGSKCRELCKVFVHAAQENVRRNNDHREKKSAIPEDEQAAWEKENPAPSMFGDYATFPAIMDALGEKPDTCTDTCCVKPAPE